MVVTCAVPANAAVKVVRPPSTPVTKLQPLPVVAKAVPVLPPLTDTAKVGPLKFSSTILNSADLTSYAMAVGNQGSVGSCVSWAVDYGMLGWWANKLGILKPFYSRLTHKVISYDWLHPMFSFHRIGSATGDTKPDDPYKGEPIRWGSGNKTALQDAETYGAPPSTDYTGALGTWDYFHEPSLAELASASRYRIKPGSWEAVFSHDGTKEMSGDEIKALKSQLMAGHPVALGIRADSLFKAWGNSGSTMGGNATGVMNGTGESGNANHAVLALGYDTSSLLIENSWGTSWGEKGWIRVSWNWVKMGVKSGYAITSNSPFVTP